jgi:hypothetical protein
MAGEPGLHSGGTRHGSERGQAGTSVQEAERTWRSVRTSGREGGEEEAGWDCGRRRRHSQGLPPLQ